MRLSHLLVALGPVVLVLACGGSSLDPPGGHGEGSSSGGASSGGAGSGSGGTTSSGSGSGGVSSSGSGSGGVSSSGSGSGGVSSSSSSGGTICPASQPGGACSPEGEECSYGGPSGCGTTCICQNSDWECFGDPCPPPPPVCGPTPPVGGSSCAGNDGLTCGYGNADGCSETECTCDGATWECSVSSCPPPPPPTCPTFPPADQSECSDIDQSCSYFVNGDCNQELCFCSPAGIWSCSYEVDCGGEDAGIDDAGIGIGFGGLPGNP